MDAATLLEATRAWAIETVEEVLAEEARNAGSAKRG
jgi:hypothetical protein